MSKASSGDTVKVHYTGKLNDDTVFDSSKNRNPLEFKIGSGQVIPGFDSAVAGMTVGDIKSVTIPMDQAYGPYREDMVLKIEKTQFPDHINPEIGQQLQLNRENENPIGVTVTKITDDSVTLDANHPLAGKDLIFEIELIEIA